uniref:Gnk2-homologous domain-containing protein n=1 Tax=Oryza meridionalis TaxID=40149 RepID=A0A0E0FDZ0_9ORYZ
MARRRHHQLLAVLLAAAAAVVAAADAQEVPYAPISNTSGCSSWNNFSVGSGYQVNLFKLLGNLAAGGAAAGSGGFCNDSYGALSDMVFGVAMCYVDRHWTKCRRCLDAATSGAAAFCPYSRRVDVMYDECVLRYSDEINLFSFADSSGSYHMSWENVYVDDMASMNATRWEVFTRLAAEEYTDSRGESLTVYGMVQCGRGLLPEECSKCLRHQLGEFITELPNNTAGIIRGYSCYSRYDTASFPVPNPNHQPVFSPSLSVCYILHRRRRDSKIRPVKLPSSSRDESVEPDLEHGGGPRRFSYGELAAATNDFSDDRKLGEGGVGSVYRGFLEGLNLHVAVKRISRSSQQGWKEFVSEVRIISRLRHRNLVLLIGCAWTELCDGMASATTLDEVMEVHEAYLSSIQRQCFVASDKLWALIASRVKTILGLALDFHNIEQTLGTGGTAPAVKARCEMEVDRIEKQFDECVVFLLRILSFKLNVGHFPHLADLVTRINYNHYYMSDSGSFSAIPGSRPRLKSPGVHGDRQGQRGVGRVALLELACGRCPVMTRPDGSAVHLAQRVRELHDAGRVTAAADGRLNGGFDGDEMERVLVVGLWCAHPDRGMRPPIRQAVNVLRFDAPLPSLPPPAKMPVAAYARPAAVDTSCSVRSESSHGDDPIGGTKGYQTF